MQEEQKKNYKRTKNGLCYEMNGWLYVSIKGNPRERGYAYGYLIADEMKKVKKILEFSIYHDFGIHWDFFVEATKKYFTEKTKEHFNEFYEEMAGFADGCTAGGTSMSVHEIIAWNNFFTMIEGWYANMPEEESNEVFGKAKVRVASREGGAAERCSAFIATGSDWTADGKIVVAHNNFSNFIDGQLARIVLDILPSKGHRMIMNSFPGWIWSGTDFFVTSKGIIGTETTIGGFYPYENNHTIACRIRNAMQYGNSLDDYVKMLLDGNSGDYANSWLFGDIHTNEIMLLELGLRFHNVQRTKNGFFIGFNGPYDPRIRNLECVNTGYDDIRRHQGARRVRLEDLMNEHKGKLNVEVAQKIIGDHYDVYLKKDNPCSRTVCSHYEMDAREYMSDPSRPKPYQPRGALDGNVCDSTLAKNMTLSLKWGSSCGTPFDKKKFCNEHREWAYLEPYLEDRPNQPWTLFSATDWKKQKQHRATKTKTKTTKNRRKKNRKTRRGLQ